VLLPVFSLPGPWGIGSFSQHARRFVEHLARAGQSIWQILPLGPTGFADSPYQSFSTFAGNPYFIDLADLVDQGLLGTAELDELDWGDDPTRVDYGKLFQARPEVLRRAHARASGYTADAGYQRFTAGAAGWLDAYALFMTIKQTQGGAPWTQWPTDLAQRQPDALDRIADQYADQLDYHRWVQWVFATQWADLHRFATRAGVQILGDTPIYVAMDSADTWANPELFELDEQLVPSQVAGVPPDGFSAGGQLWGNPLYDWEVHRSSGFAWWIERLRYQLEALDILRIDHFRGLESYWAVPYGATDASGGNWRPGPGIDFFTAIANALDALPLVAEDLGYLTDAVRELREAAGLPGMQIIQFAFDSRERGNYWPHNYARETVVYTGTHDNPTLQQWFASLSAADQQRSREYLHNWWTPPELLHWDFITLAMRTVGDTVVVPMADYLGLGAEGRINTPSVACGNWRWRMGAEDFDDALVDRIARLTTLAERSRQ
jgi:4-alpha-glucanotransferase